MSVPRLVPDWVIPIDPAAAGLSDHDVVIDGSTEGRCRAGNDLVAICQ
jgi:hypothetical protein